MPRLVHQPPTYSLHKPSGRARVRYRGRDHYLPGPYGSAESRKAYAGLIDRLLNHNVAPEATEAPDAAAPNLLTIAELIERFWDHAEVYYRRDGKPTGEHQVIRAALRPLLKMFGAILVTEFKPKHVKLVRDEMIRLDWSRRYINSSVGRIKRMLSWGVEAELVSPEVAGAVASVKGLRKDRSQAREKPKVKAVPDELIEATLPHVSRTVSDLIQFMRLSGARPGEALAMTVEAIDRSDPTCWEYRPQEHKTQHHDKDRVIFIGPRCQSILTPRILKAGSGRVFRITKSGLRKSIDIGCERAKVPHWAPGMLRHSSATAIRKRFGLEGSQVILGHAKADTTEIYAELDSDRARQIARAVG
jgi:integrase